jgi:conjugative relaxase-like TrwC/TraI family protein
VGVVTTLKKGYDTSYPWKTMGSAEGGMSSAGYYMAEGEPPGRWFGRGAEALGLVPGSRVGRKTYDLVVDQRLDPRDGVTRLGRSPAKAISRTDAVYQRLIEAEPWATESRRWELRAQAQREARQGPLYMDLTVSLSKSISVFYASLGENWRRAKEAGDLEGMAHWAGLIGEVDEMIHAANQAGLEFFEREAGWTRTGYHGGRAGEQQTGQFREAGLVVASFLQHTSRADDVQLHVHNVIPQAAQTDADGKWRAPWSFGYNKVHSAVAPIVALHLESALSARFGVEWTARADGFGHEMTGIGQAVMDCMSTRRDEINEETRDRADEFERDNGRKPTQRELAQIAQAVTLETRKQKTPEKPLSVGGLHESWADTIRAAAGVDLGDIAPSVWGEDASRQPAAGPDGGPGPSSEALARAAEKALAETQARRSAWTLYDLIKHLGCVMPAEVRHMAPQDAVRLLHQVADDILASRHGDVECLEAPQPVRLPERLMRADGRSVYQPHGTTRYATRAHLGVEQLMVTRARRALAPMAARERVAQLLGADAATLDAQLRLRAEAGSDTRTLTGLRLDQAAAIYSAYTDGRLATTLTGPAGSGKTHTLTAAAKAAKQAGVPEVWGVTCAQAARNVLADAAEQAGASVNAYNSARLFTLLDSGRAEIAPGSLIIIDEASVLPSAHLARLMQLADARDCKMLIAGDQEQLTAVEGGGAMRLLARENGYVQLAQPVRFEQEWERPASLRLRAGDASVLDEYDQRGRIRGGRPEQVMDDAVRDAVAERLAGRDVLLMARERERCRELARRVRAELAHFGLVGDGPGVLLAEGAQATPGDLVLARANDHPRGIANGDLLRVEEIAGDTVTLRKATDRDPATGVIVLAGNPITCDRDALATFDLGYCSTGHAGMGRTVTTGLPVVTGAEDRQWLYTAMTRGAARNTAYVMSRSPREADPAAGPEPAPELGRHDRLQRQRDGLPAGPAPEAREQDREPAAVLADILGRDSAEKSATEIQHEEAANADHLATFHAIWQGEIEKPRTERYRQILRDTLPAEHANAGSAPQATWLWRTLRGAEAAGLDARQVVEDAVRSRSLDGARDVASVIDARIRERAGSLPSLPPGTWASQVPEGVDAETRGLFTDLAGWMDERTQRLGQFTADSRPEWAVRALGEVPADPGERATWAGKAAKVAAYRELYGYDHPADPIGPEPSADSPEQRAAWHAGLQALGPVDGPDVRGEPDGRLWLMRDQLAAETAWLPKYVAPELRLLRLGAQDAQRDSALAEAEAAAAQREDKSDKAQLHQAHAKSARALHAWYEQRAADLEPHDAKYREAEHVTEATRRLATAADSVLRRRHPERHIEPLQSAEPGPVTEPEREQLLSPEPEALAEPAKPPEWVGRLAAARDALQEKLDERKAVRIPADDHEMQDLGDAWPAPRPRERDAILQPPPPEIPPSPRLGDRDMGRDIDREAGE